MNNLKSYTLLSDKFDTQFGFTTIEVDKLFRDCNQLDKLEEAKNWYNGYQFGNQVIYNPWSLLNLLDEGQLKPYWVNTLEQVKAKQYAQALKDVGITHIMLLGIGCKGKELLVLSGR